MPDTNGITYSFGTPSIASLDSAENLAISGGTLELTSTTQESKTDASGNFSFDNVLPTKDTEYRAMFAGDQASRLNDSTSNTELVEVKVKLTLKVSRATVTLGKKVTISAAVSPEHTGAVQLTIKRGKTVVVNRKRVRLNGSLYKRAFKPTRTGSYTVIVSFARDHDHLGNTATTKFKVTR